MPSLGADMDSGTVIEWRVAPGDVVHRGDIVAVVDTDKSDIEVEVFDNGVVEELLVDVGAEVAVGTPLARIAPMAAAPADASIACAARRGRRRRSSRRSAVSRSRDMPLAPVMTSAPPTSGRGHDGRHVAASPRARRRAAELAVDLTDLTGSGPAGAVITADVEAAAAADDSRGRRHASASTPATLARVRRTCGGPSVT